MAEVEFRLHGRGGQGVVVAADIFAAAVFKEGWYARSLCSFGAERRGAPVTAFIRMSKHRLMPRCGIYRPDYVLCFDPSLLEIAGLQPGGTLVINTSGINDKQWESYRLSYNIWILDARAVAFKCNLTSGGLPMVNTALLGALSKASGLASPESLQEVIKQRGLQPLTGNLQAVEQGYHLVKEAFAN